MKAFRLYAGLICAAILAGCAAVQPNLPSITDSATHAHYNGKVVWHDLLTSTPEASRKFYHELFGWEFEMPGIDLGFGKPGAYMLIRHNGELIGGMFDATRLNKKVDVSQWITVISVDDIDAAVYKVMEDDAIVLTPPTDVQNRGVIAVVEDPTGAIVAFLQTKDGDPRDKDPAVNGFLWDELWSDDVERASNFYHHVIGYKRNDHEVGDVTQTYHVLTVDDKPRAGMLTQPFEGQRSVWVNYIRVDDPVRITSRVEALGGQILIPAQNRSIGGQVAFIAGPSGAGIAVQTWPLVKAGEAE